MGEKMRFDLPFVIDAVLLQVLQQGWIACSKNQFVVLAKGSAQFIADVLGSGSSDAP